MHYLRKIGFPPANAGQSRNVNSTEGVPYTLFNPVIDKCERQLRLAARPGVIAAVVIASVALYLTSDPSPAAAHHFCPNTGSPFGPFEMDTYEAADYKELYAATFELGGFNQIGPEYESFALPGIETGNRGAGSEELGDPYIPPVILKSISFLESGWAQASYDPLVEYGEIGPVLSSHDCGYGLMQITTGMQNVSNVPNLDQVMIGTHYAFNVARGARILADKWNMSPETRPIVGARESELIENWYYALWGYNGFAYSNHPLNPAYQINRIPYSCGPTGDGFGHDRTQYPYQELVFGCIERPPTRSGTLLWESIETHLPELTDAKFAGPLDIGNWNDCAYSAQCEPMDIPTPNTNHQDPTEPSGSREEILGEPILALPVETINLNLTPSKSSKVFTFQVRNLGSGVLGYQAITTNTWLDVIGGSAGVALGDDLGGDDGKVTLLADASAIQPGEYTATVKVSSLYADNAPQVYTIKLTYGTATPKPPTSVVWGDNDCSIAPPNPVDSLLTLRFDAGLSVNMGGCPPFGSAISGSSLKWGDVDCSGDVGPIDALKILRFDAGEAVSQAAGCPALGSDFDLSG
jgi:hypothetical protein